MTKKELKGVFDSHPTVNEIFVTNDSQVFFTEEAADSHASRLLKKDVTNHSRFENGVELAVDEFLQDTGHADNLVNGSAVTAGSEYITLKNDGKPSVIFDDTNAVKSPDAAHTVVKAVAPVPVPVTPESIGAVGTEAGNTAAAADTINDGIASATLAATGSNPETAASETAKDAATQAQSADVTNEANTLKEQPAADKEKKAADALQKAIDTPEAERSGYQKGLITKAANDKAKGESK